jgi:hypothetical protein
MTGIFAVLVFFAMAATLGALVLGIVGMFTDSPFYNKHKNALMRWRVLFQAIALGLLALTFMMK